MIVETNYAVVFHALVMGGTTGENGVWFADGQDPKFEGTNRITRWNNLALVTGVSVVLGDLWGRLS